MCIFTIAKMEYLKPLAKIAKFLFTIVVLNSWGVLAGLMVSILTQLSFIFTIVCLLLRRVKDTKSKVGDQLPKYMAVL
ncbi:MAG: hypothetical protein CMM76_16595 [Rhodospirillaceae bacterium]|nr:hypothetical protein [Rhodospirillaceae bacterium]